MIHYLLLAACLHAPLTLSTSDRQIVSFIGQRSYIPKLDYQMIDWDIERNDIYAFEIDVTLEITKSFRPERITQCLLGDDSLKCKQTLVISGSQTQHRMKNKILLKKHFKECKPCHTSYEKREQFSTDWLAEYFGLPPDFKSFVHFRPRVNECITTTHLQWELDPLLDGLHLDFYLPLNYTKWDLNIAEHVEESGVLGYDEGYASPGAVPRDHLCPNFTSFITGCCMPQTNDTFTQPLKYAKMGAHGLRTIRLAEFIASADWNFRRTDHYRLGTGLFCSAPTGTLPNGDYLFEPIAGNGHFWYAGGHIYGSVHTARNEENGSFCTVHGDIAVSNLFSSRQKRSFDAKGKPNSRYMLVEKIEEPAHNMLEGNGIPADKQFKKELAPLANISTLDVDVSIGAQFNINAFFSYTCGECSWLFGYRYWTRSCDHIKVCDRNQFPSGQWAFKGDSYVYGFVAEDGLLPIGTPVALSATQSGATIHAGKNNSIRGTTDPAILEAARRNPSIDNAQLATAGSNQRLNASRNDTSSINQTHTSIQPRTLSLCDINLDSARTTGTVQTIVAAVNHTWAPREDLTISAGFGTDVDFGRNSEPTPLVEIDDCINCAFSAWKVYAHVSCTFD